MVKEIPSSDNHKPGLSSSLYLVDKILPVPCSNIVNGGKHADNNFDFQEFMVAPHCAQPFNVAIHMDIEVFHSL